MRASPKIVSAALVLALLAWLFLLLGLLYAKFVVSEPPPNVVITFSNKGLTRLLVELLSLGLGFLGFILAVVGFVGAARTRALALAGFGSISVCAVCFALLM